MLPQRRRASARAASGPRECKQGLDEPQVVHSSALRSTKMVTPPAVEAQSPLVRPKATDDDFGDAPDFDDEFEPVTPTFKPSLVPDLVPGPVPEPEPDPGPDPEPLVAPEPAPAPPLVPSPEPQPASTPTPERKTELTKPEFT